MGRGVTWHQRYYQLGSEMGNMFLTLVPERHNTGSTLLEITSLNCLKYEQNSQGPDPPMRWGLVNSLPAIFSK